MGIQIPCPICGTRDHAEFKFGGELRDLESPDAEADFRRVYLRENAAGPQVERWFHAAGCRRWVTVRRDTVSNRVDGQP